ncbi:MAG TPA: TIGR03118 family protein [Acidobacteriaceae bacterium]|nr:TIGR03118 family protein [Acidobacteriaceae bacterium]
MRRTLLKAFAALSLFAAGLSPAAEAQAYKVTNLVSDGSVPAVTTDPNFLNPWAISASGTWWVSTANSGFNYVIPSATNAISFKVIVPPAGGGTTKTGTPTGSVTTGGASGMILPNGTKASFIFSTLDGTISGWNSRLGTANAICQIVIDNSAAGAVYPGLAILNVNATTSYVLAPNFGTGNAVEVYDSNFKPAKLAGNFTDPNLPSGYSPYGIHIINNQVWVTYALRSTAKPFQEVVGPGNGIVDVFDATGTLVSRAVTGGNLNAPWGVAIAPSTFGIYSGDLLIGNFGDGRINVYDPKSYAYLGQLMDSTGKPLTYASLWELLPGGTTVGNTTAVSGGDTSTVYFTAGLDKEAHGLLAGISNGPVSGASPTFGFSASTQAATVTAGNTVITTLAVAPVNGFNGAVTFACTNLPPGTACTFSPSSVTASASAPVTSSLTLTTTTKTASSHPLGLPADTSTGITLALLLPLSSLLWFRRRGPEGRLRRPFIHLAAVLLLAGTGAVLAGCGNSGPKSTPTPTGQSTVTITATSGSTSQQTTLGLTVQ